jgi:hypothetical protein
MERQTRTPRTEEFAPSAEQHVKPEYLRVVPSILEATTQAHQEVELEDGELALQEGVTYSQDLQKIWEQLEAKRGSATA